MIIRPSNHSDNRVLSQKGVTCQITPNQFLDLLDNKTNVIVMSFNHFLTEIEVYEIDGVKMVKFKTLKTNYNGTYDCSDFIVEPLVIIGELPKVIHKEDATLAEKLQDVIKDELTKIAKKIGFISSHDEEATYDQIDADYEERFKASLTSNLLDIEQIVKNWENDTKHNFVE